MLVVGLRLPVVQSEACSKCGYFKKSGKRSCCAVGGAWFKDCGDVNNANVNHTWVEGVEACSEFAGESSGEAAMQGMLRHETTMSVALQAAQEQDISPQHTTTISDHMHPDNTPQNMATKLFQHQSTTSTTGDEYNCGTAQQKRLGKLI